MNKLEQQIFDAQSVQLDWVDPEHMELIAEIAAEIVVKHIEDAYSKGADDQYDNMANKGWSTGHSADMYIKRLLS